MTAKHTATGNTRANILFFCYVSTTFLVAGHGFEPWSPEADSVSLNMYSTGSDGEKNGKAESTKIGTYAMEKSFEADNTWKGVWEYTLEGDKENE